MSQPPPYQMDPFGKGPGRSGVPPQSIDAIGHERVGNAQRTAVLDLLSRAVEEGYLDLDEYEARVGRVTDGKTISSLYAQVADLPPQFRWDPFRPTPKGRQERERDSANAMAVASLALGAAAIPTSLCFGAGGIAGIVAVFLARRSLRHDADKTKAIAGLVLGIVGIALSIGFVLLFLLSPEQTTTK